MEGTLLQVLGNDLTDNLIIDLHFGYKILYCYKTEQWGLLLEAVESLNGCFYCVFIFFLDSGCSPIWDELCQRLYGKESVERKVELHELHELHELQSLRCKWSQGKSQRSVSGSKYNPGSVFDEGTT